MSLTLHSLAALALLLGPQQPEAEEPLGRPEPRTSLLDRVHLVVNNDIVTAQTLQRSMDREIRSRRLNSRAEVDALREAILANEVEKLLRVQAGQDLDLPPEMIALQLRGYEERFVERLGGVIATSERFDRAGLDSSEVRKQWERELLDITWRQSVTGQGPAAGGRVIHDRYVRPGQLRREYESYRASVLTGRGPAPAQIGGYREKVRLQELLIVASQAGGPKQARKLIGEALERARAGENFESLIRIYTEGLLPNVDASELGRVEAEVQIIERANPEFTGFLVDAKPGDISGIYPVLDGSQREVGYRILHFVERFPAFLPPFESRETQAKLRQVVLDREDNRRVDEALSGLFQEAYIWPPELAQQGGR